MTLVYNISERGSDSIYEFLYKCIRSDIRSGRLPAGTRLPSKRVFAADNGVALVTVENAYAQLLVEGYAEAKQRSGYYVADIGLIETEGKAEKNAAADRADDHEASDDEALIREKTGTVYDLTASNISADSFPYAAWTKILRAVISDREKDFAFAPPSEGIAELRTAIADYVRETRAVEINPGNVIIGPGTEYLHSIIVQLVGRNRFAAVEDPGYSKPGLIYTGNGMKVLYIPMDEEGIDIDALVDSNVRLVHTSPSHQFPTGTVMSASRRHRLINWAEEQEAYIIEDDYDSEFRFKGRPLPPLLSLDRDRVIYMNTFSGTLAASIRIAYMILPDALMKIYRDKLSFLSGTVSAFEQLTLAEFISGGFYERHINRMKNKYRKIRCRYENALELSLLREYAEFKNDDAGLQMNLMLHDPDIGKDDKIKRGEAGADPGSFRLQKQLRDKGIILQTISDYCHRRSDMYSGQLLLKLADMEEKELVNIFNEIYRCMYALNKSVLI